MRRGILSLSIASVLALSAEAGIAQVPVQQGQNAPGNAYSAAQVSTSTDQLDRLLREGEAVVQRLRRSSVLSRPSAPAGAVSGPAAAHLRQRADRLWRLLDIEAKKLVWRRSARGPLKQERFRLLQRVENLRSRLDQARRHAAAGEWKASLLERRRHEPMLEEYGLRSGASLGSHSAETSEPPRSGGQRAPSALAPPGNDDCANATPIGNGTFSGDTSEATNDGSASCGASGAAPDVWFKYTAPAAGFVSFDTFGSSYDTVLSLHSSCPGTTINQLACNDDTAGLQSQVTRDVTAGEELLVRVSGFAGSTGSFVLNVGLPGSISGVVTEDGSGTPLAGVLVDIFDASGSFKTLEVSALDGSYSVVGLAPGSYFAVTRSFALPHIDELFDDIPCPGGAFAGGCSPTTGTPIVVTASGDIAGIDFALTLGGSISGTVTEDGSGTALAGVAVEIVSASGSFVGLDFTAPDGTYSLSGLASGTYFAVTSAAVPHIDELFDDIPCPGGRFTGCDPATGTPIVVTAPGDTTGIDFALTLGGRISGTVTEDGTGIPLADVQVEIFDPNRFSLGFVVTAPDGSYSFDGLASGSYFAATSGSAPYIDELFDDIPCFGGRDSGGCDPVTGERIQVTAPGDTGGIDFALTLGGTISGTVTEDGTGIPLAGIQVELFVARGFSAGFVVTAPDGSYSFDGLASSSYFAVTFRAAPHVDELFDNIRCAGGAFGGCDPTAGTPIEVTAPGDTTGIDFALTLGGTIGGTVTEDGTGAPLANIGIDIFDASGSFVDDDRTAHNGSYTVGGLPPGSYFAATSRARPYVDELFDDLPCPFGGIFGCEPTAGTPIAVTAPGKTLGIDFALTLGGTISGTATEDGTGNRLGGVGVQVFNASGLPTGDASTFGNGTYAVNGLPSGSYFVATSRADPYVDELFDGLPCPFGSCDPTIGTPVPVVAPGATSGIDFSLALGGTIRGMVVEDGSGVPLAFVDVGVFDAGGRVVGFGETLRNGVYAVTGLPSDIYFAVTSGAAPHVDELFDDIPCPGGGFAGGCDPTTGTRIAVYPPGGNSWATFSLALGGSLSGTVTDGASGLPTFGVRVDVFDAAGSSVGSGFTAGNGVYAVTGLATGEYFARTFNSRGRRDERYDDLSCVGTCDPSLGTAIPVVQPGDTPGVDFVLYRLGENPDLVLQKEEIFSDDEFCASQTITVGPDFGVRGTASVSFTGGLSVVFLSHFNAGSGVSIEVGTDPSVTCP